MFTSNVPNLVIPLFLMLNYFKIIFKKRYLKDEQYCSSFYFYSHLNAHKAQKAPTGKMAPPILPVWAFLVSKSTIMAFYRYRPYLCKYPVMYQN